MSDEIVFYHNPLSRGRIAHWMLEEVGEPYRIELLRFDKSEHKAPAYLAINPMGKVPAIVHRGVVVTEAAAICAYLADSFPQRGLAPALDDLRRRGTYLRWLFFTAANFEPAMLDKATPRPNPPTSSQLGYGSYEQTLAALEQALEPGPFVLGEQFSAADVYIASQLDFSLRMKWLEPRPRFTSYLERVQQRPAWQRARDQAGALVQQLKS